MTLPAEVDRAHEPATQRILKRENEGHGKAEYVRLAGISASHIYNLRSQANLKVLEDWVAQRVRSNISR